jgi:predicted phosphodiesterase
MTTTLIIADTHWDHRFPLHPSYNLIKRFIKDLKPDEIVVAGDILELEIFAKFSEGLPGTHYKNNIKYDLKKDIQLARAEIAYLKKYTNKFTLLEGNHDIRLEKYKEKNPELAEIADLSFLLEEPLIKQVDQPYYIKDTAILHGNYCNKYHAAKHLETYISNVIYGHVHNTQTFTRRIPRTNEVIQAHSIGCLFDIQPAYKRGTPTAHNNGFAIMESHKDLTTIQNIVIYDNKFIYRGKIWK